MKKVIKKGTKTSNRDFPGLLGKQVMQEKVNIQKENSFQLTEESRFYSERINVETVNQSFYPSVFVWRGLGSVMERANEKGSKTRKKRRCCNSLTKTDNPFTISLEVKPKLKLKRRRKLVP